jgi:hypothetical protein
MNEINLGSGEYIEFVFKQLKPSLDYQSWISLVKTKIQNRRTLETIACEISLQ